MTTSGILIVLIVALLIVIVVYFLLNWFFRTRVGSSPDQQRTGPIFRDDDRYWRGGFIYYNPDDPDLFVPSRFGFGWAMNYGHPQARRILVGILVLALVVGLLSVLSVALFPGPHHSRLF